MAAEQADLTDRIRYETVGTLLRRDVLCTVVGGLAGIVGGVAVSEGVQHYAEGMQYAPMALRIGVDFGAAFLYGTMGAGAGFFAATMYGLHRFFRRS